MFKRFSDWMLASESSPITRLKWDAALGLKPPMAPASVNSKATAIPWQHDALKDTPVASDPNTLDKPKKKHKKKKSTKKKPKKKG
jgi:hypothetical protein